MDESKIIVQKCGVIYKSEGSWYLWSYLIVLKANRAEHPTCFFLLSNIPVLGLLRLADDLQPGIGQGKQQAVSINLHLAVHHADIKGLDQEGL